MLVYRRVAAIAGANHHFWIQQTLGAESVVTVEHGNVDPDVGGHHLHGLGECFECASSRDKEPGRAND